ncbi:MAG: glycine cleavage system protein GcvH [Candidatus Neomarinimicrobiota bacterium]|uniref:Lipoyl-binding domain-containing protein n=1 Tax=marine metagenome TaxID=408172 RepID=A0A381QLL8_9ZZZZ|nr:glycine cleavage system protein GcvH [Candidatus Neomarinimicrobiota bacterium]MEE3139179.1 glycine cleavage system protein GcvH [Candidatus Neomarinimicrobiota bacterium]
MNIPKNLLYTSEHEWVKIEGNTATIGITDFAQGELGDIIFLEFPDLDAVFNVGDIFGTIEAVKTVSDLYMPLEGKIVEVNNILNDNPEKVNEDPYGKGWMVKIIIDENTIKNQLLDSKKYNQLIT